MGLRSQAPMTFGGWGFAPRPPPVTRISCTTLVGAPPKWDILRTKNSNFWFKLAPLLSKILVARLDLVKFTSQWCILLQVSSCQFALRLCFKMFCSKNKKIFENKVVILNSPTSGKQLFFIPFCFDLIFRFYFYLWLVDNFRVEPFIGLQFSLESSDWLITSNWNICENARCYFFVYLKFK